MLPSLTPGEISRMFWGCLRECPQVSAGRPRCPLALGIGPFSKWLSWRLRTANALNSHWTWRQCMGLLYLHRTITGEQGSFQLPVILISSIYWFWRYCIRLNAMPFIFFNPLPCSINMITKVNLKLIMPAYNSITYNSAFADTGSHSYYDNSS